MAYVQAALTVYSAWSSFNNSRKAEKRQRQAMMQQALYQAEQDRKRAENIKIQKKDVFRKAYEDQEKVYGNVRKMLGSQRASFAAKGIDINSGISAMIQEETKRFGSEDITTIKDNAQRAAWGMDNEIEQLYDRANNAIEAGMAQSNNIAEAGKYQREGMILNTVGNLFSLGSNQQKSNQQNLRFSRSG